MLRPILLEELTALSRPRSGRRKEGKRVARKGRRKSGKWCGRMKRKEERCGERKKWERTVFTTWRVANLNESDSRKTFPGVVVINLRWFQHALSNASEKALVLQTDRSQIVRLRLYHCPSSAAVISMQKFTVFPLQ